MKYILCLVLLLGFLYADDHEHEKHHHYYNKDLTFLNLSSTQQKDIKKLLKEYRKNLKNYREYKEDILEQKEDIFKDDTFDQNKFIQLNLKLSQQSSKIQTQFLEQIHQILSKDQRKLFIKYLDEWEIE